LSLRANTVGWIMFVSALVCMGLAWTRANDSALREACRDPMEMIEWRLSHLTEACALYVSLYRFIPLVIMAMLGIAVQSGGAGDAGALALQPGLVACRVCVAAVVCQFSRAVVKTIRLAVACGGLEATVGLRHFAAWKSLLPSCRPSEIGISILAAWITLCITVGWRSVSTWSDRVGRALGCCWIFAYLAEALVGWVPASIL
jgi:hypothetical protein